MDGETINKDREHRTRALLNMFNEYDLEHVQLIPGLGSPCDRVKSLGKASKKRSQLNLFLKGT